MKKSLILILFNFYLTCVFSQSWTVAPNLSTGRYGHGAATSPDGKIYIAGGNNSFNQPLNTVLKYDPLSNGGWTPVASMVNPRSNLAFVTGTDGFIYAIGGNQGNVTVKFVERYNPKTDNWTTMAPLPDVREGVTASVAPDGRIYVFGGVNLNGDFSKSILAFNPPTTNNLLGDWVTVYDWNGVVTNNPDSKTYLTELATTNEIYMFGANDNLSNNNLFWQKINNQTSNFSSPTYLTQRAAGWGTVSAPNGKIYLYGGLQGSPPVFPANNFIEFNALNNSLGNSSLFPNSRRNANATTAEGKIFIIGGERSNNSNQQIILKNTDSYGPIKAAIPNIKMFWKFENNLNDIVGANNGSMQVAANYVNNGRVGKSLKFNGSQNLTVPNSNTGNFNFTDINFSIEGWIKWSGHASGTITTIIDKRTVNSDKYRGFSVFIYQNGKLGVQLANGTVFENYIAANTEITTNNWTHFAVTIDRNSPNKSIKIYINGVFDKSFVPLQGSIATTAPLLLGKHQFNNTFFKGELDEISLYNKPLTWIEIRSIILAGKEGKL